MGGVRLVLVICLCKAALTMIGQVISISMPRLVTSSAGPSLEIQTDPRCPRDQRYLQSVIYEAGIFRCCELKLCSESRELKAIGYDLLLTACFPCPIHGYIPDWWKVAQACALIAPVFYFFAISIGGLLLCFGTRYLKFSVAGFCITNGIAGILSIFSASYITAKLTAEPQLIMSGSQLFSSKYNINISGLQFVPDLGFYFSLLGGIISLATSGFFYLAARHGSDLDDKSENKHGSNGNKWSGSPMPPPPNMQVISQMQPGQYAIYAHPSCYATGCIGSTQNLVGVGGVSQEPTAPHANNQNNQNPLINIGFVDASPTMKVR